VRDVAEGRAGGGAVAARLAELADDGQAPERRREYVLEVLACRVVLAFEVGDAPEAQLVGGVDDRLAVGVDGRVDGARRVGRGASGALRRSE
jgi:hypothetical protein